MRGGFVVYCGFGVYLVHGVRYSAAPPIFLKEKNVFYRTTDEIGTDQYRPVPDSRGVSPVPAGIYDVEEDRRGMYLAVRKFEREKYIPLGDHYREVRRELDTFFSAETRRRLESFGVHNRRGALLYGPPGTGKTSAILHLASEFVEAFNAVVLVDPALPHLIAAVKAVRTDDSSRSIIVLWDEFDEIVAFHERKLIEWLDGVTSVNHAFSIGITNYVERLPGRIVDRPSRFGLVMRVNNPTVEERVYYLERVFSGISADLALAIATMTEHLSIDHTKDVAVLHLAHNRPLEEIEQNIDRVAEMQGASKGGKKKKTAEDEDDWLDAA